MKKKQSPQSRMPPTEQEIVKILTQIKDQKLMTVFLKDILTPQELDGVARRWQLIKLLNQGLTQREISKKLSISVATVTRGSRQLKYGFGGFKKVLAKYDR